MNFCSFLRWVSGAGSGGTQVEALQSQLHHVRQIAHAAFVRVNGGNSLLLPSFCPSSVGPHLTPKEEVTSVKLVSSATDSDQSRTVTLAHLPLLPLPYIQLLLL